ncbi:hypothetical protein [Halomonas ramblicola]|uniref:hypothetical protein n=1 Tax=Halomonas ramblicola TaxID=747349 RepID=UPI0025B3AF95|nr:hypothetical protein [Halomonas ramblicola]MDN3521861.1 hypothetical protein [Halomonas ramblicola]
MEDIRGNLRSYPKQEIAMEYLNLALREYVAGRNLIAVINLSGAAEEMLGKIVSLKKNESAFQRAQRWTRSWFKLVGKETPANKDLNKHLLKVKNGIKHIDGKDDMNIEFDIDREAKEAIRRAIENFNQIPGISQSAEILAYYQRERT